MVAHEYGHHIANNRRNDLAPALEWGTKRWASHEHVCETTVPAVSFRATR